MTGISRENLRSYLHNSPLVQAITQKQDVNDTRKSLCSALTVMQKTEISDIAQKEVQQKIDEYGKISRNYGNLIEDTWEVTWQMETVIKKYIDCCDEDIDKLPDYIKF